MRSSKTLSIIGLISLCACGPAGNDPAPAHAAPDDNGSDAGAESGGGTCIKHGGADEPDDKGLDDNCDGADGVVGVDVYVSTSGADTNAGTPSQPLRTIVAALKLATGRAGKVLVSSGSHTLDALKVTGSWSVFGGYSATFLGAPKRASTTLVGGVGGVLIDGAQSARLAHVTVRGASATDDKHPHALALVSNVDSLTLDDVALEAGDGRDGARGATGTSGTPGATGGNADTATQLVCGGVLQPPFSFGATKYLANAEGKHPGNLSTSTPSESGSDGSPGTDGADADGAPKLINGSIATGLGTAGASNGRPGYGGPGGGGGSSDQQQWYIGGAGGSGGCPGMGGGGGASGGASIALLVLRGSIQVTRSHYKTGLGGAGGDGGTGGAGGAGGKPGSPSASPDLPSAFPAPCTPANDPAHANCAEYGGTGGAGGLGGHGGGGAGGWSIGLAIATGATAQVDDVTTCDLGRPGTGGTGNGGGRASDGKNTRHYAIP